MNKKGSSFWILIFTLVFVFILFFCVFKLIDKYGKISNSKAIGERQEELLHLYQKGEKFLLYNDQVAKLAGEQALYEYGKNGGMKERKCGSYKGYAVWDFTKECFAKEEELTNYFSSSMDRYAGKYHDKGVTIPADNYIFVVRNANGQTEITGIAKQPITIEVNR